MDEEEEEEGEEEVYLFVANVGDVLIGGETTKPNALQFPVVASGFFLDLDRFI